MFDVAVVGAGPAGVSSTYFLSSKGYGVIVFERSAGFNSICGEFLPDPDSLGIRGEIASQYFDFFRPFILNNISEIRLEAFGREFEFGYRGYSIDRREMLKRRAQEAESAGARILRKEIFLGLKRAGEYYRIFTNNGEFEAKYVVGADGFPSRIAEILNGRNSISCDDLSIAFPMELHLNLDDPSEMRIIVDEELAPGAYAWVIPRGESSANIGFGVRMVAYEGFDPYKAFSKLFERVGVTKEIGRRDIRGRFVPVGGLCKVLAKNGIFLAGDSAGMVVPSNGGGIYTAIISSYLLSLSLEADCPEESYYLSVRKYVKPLVETGLTYRRAADALMRLGILRRIIGLVPSALVAEAITGNKGKYYGFLKLVSYLYSLSKGRGGSHPICERA